MNRFKRPVVIAGNWKMYKTNEEAVEFVEDLIPLIEAASSTVYLAVPYTAISLVASQCLGTKIILGAQNMNDHREGAFTGEISGSMLKQAGAQFVILGHSERRQLFHETNEFVNRKVKMALEIGLKPIVCIGETSAEREDGHTIKVLTSQLKHSLAGLNEEQMAQVMLAYEPIWAIGTQQAAMPSVAEEIHFFCRRYLANQYGTGTAEKVLILYGGSVKPDNAGLLLEQNNVDGFLIGTASLSVDSFGEIVNLSKGPLKTKT
jgi:triosephosphate isomerase (TIM)